MDSRFRFYLFVLGALLVLYGVAESYRPRAQSWARTYRNIDHIPYGTFALVELLPDLFDTRDVTVVREPVLNQLQQAGFYVREDAAPTNQELPSGMGADEATGDVVTVTDSADDSGGVTATPPAADSAVAAWKPPTTDENSAAETAAETPTDEPINYLFVAPQVNFDSLDTRALLRFAAAGHHILLAADYLPAPLLRHLGLVARPYAPVGHAGLLRDTVAIQFAGDSTGRAYRFGTADIKQHFRQRGRVPDPSLRGLATDAGGRTVLVRARRGFGSITLCAMPTAFTNYFVVRPRTAGFAWRALSGLPPGPVWWDEYSKQGRAESDSPLRVVMSRPALRIAFWLILGGGLLLLWVGGRRRQRVLPVLAPLPNNTLQFVRTVAGLYRQGDNHALIAHRKIDLFLDYLRTRYREPTDDLAAPAFRSALTQKTGLPRADIDVFFRRLTDLQAANYVSDGELLWLSQTLSEFRAR